MIIIKARLIVPPRGQQHRSSIPLLNTMTDREIVPILSVQGQAFSMKQAKDTIDKSYECHKTTPYTPEPLQNQGKKS